MKSQNTNHKTQIKHKLKILKTHKKEVFGFGILDLKFIWKLVLENWKFLSMPRRVSRGQAAIIAVLFLMSAMLVVTSGFSSLALRQAKIVRATGLGTESYFLAEAGVEDALYRLKTGRRIDDEEVISLGGNTVTTVIQIEGGDGVVSARGDAGGHIRILEASVALGSGVDFNYGVHVGEGGLTIENNATVQGNVFSSGPVDGDNNNLIHGSVISAGSTGSVEGIHATSSVHAHTIENSFIEGDAHYQVIDGATTVLGAKYPGSSDIATTSLPISEETVLEWEAAAEAGGMISSPCPYVIKNDETLGPVKIACSLEIQGSPTVTLGGPVWVVGDIIIKNSATVRLALSLGEKSVAVIADDSENRLEKGTIKVENTTVFQNSGTEGSYILFLSMNESAFQGGGTKAIEVSNQADAGALLVYAGKGEIVLQNKIKLREVTGYKVRLKNNAEIIYETGLANLLFDTGPGGGYDILGWKEVE